MNQEAQRKGGRPSTITRTLGENLRSYHIPAEDARQLNERYCRKILRKYGVDTSGLSLEQQREAVITRQNELASNGQLCKWKSFKHQYDAFERRQRLCEAFVESAHRKIMQGKMCPPSEKKQRPSLLRFESPNFVEPASSVDSTRSLPRVPASVTPKSKDKDKNKDKDHKKKPAAGATDQDSPAANTTTATVGTFATPSSTTAVAAAATTKEKSKMLPASPKATVTPAAAAGVHKPTSKVVPRPTAAATTTTTTTGAGASATPATETVASNNVRQTPSTASTHPHPVSVAKNKQHKGTTPKDEAGHKKIPAAAIKGVHSSTTTHSSGPGGPPRVVDSSDPSSLSESESTRSDEDNNLDNETNLDGGPRVRYTGNADAPMMDVPETDDFLLAEPQDDDDDDEDDAVDNDDFNDSSSAASDSSSENEEHTPFRSDHADDRMQDQDDGVQDQDQDQDEDQDMFEPSAPFEIFLADRLDTLQEFTMSLGEKLDNIYLTLVKQTQSKAKARRHGKGKRTVTDKVELKRGDSDDPRVSQPARVSTLGAAKVTKHKKKHNKVNNNNKSKKEKYQVEGADL